MRADFADGYAIYVAAFNAGLRPEIDMQVSEWSEMHRKLSQKSASEPGPWRNDRTPYLIEIMDSLSSDSPTEIVSFMKGTQVGGTESGNNWLGYVVHHSPAPMMIVQPTLGLAKRFSKHRVAPMIETMPILRDLIQTSRTRDSGNTTLMKDFPGGALVIAGANSAADLRSMPCKYLFFDEVDAYPYDLDGEGDPIGLAEKRSTNFARRKTLKVSTPTTKGFSRIEDAFNAGTREHYQVPCPHCGEFQWLKWANIRWDKDDDRVPLPDTAHYVCEHCGCIVEEHQKTLMLSQGKWIADNPHASIKHRSFHLSALYSPLGWSSWASIVQRFLEANAKSKTGDDTKMKLFINTDLAETWEEQGDKVETSNLQKRAETYLLRTVPEGGLLLVAGIDTQGNRLEVVVKAYGRGEESWTIDWRVFHGDPAQEQVWAELDAYLQAPIQHESGTEMRIAACAIDSGGHHTHHVYAFCRGRAYRHVIAVKGQSQAAKPVIGRPTEVEINYKGVKIKRGVKLWPVGSDTAKSLIYGRMRIDTVGPGYMHFSDELTEEYYEQLTAERLITRYHRGHARMEWVKPNGKRNEVLDCEVYAYAAAMYLGVTRYRELDWQKLEMPHKQRDLLVPYAASKPKPAAPAEQPTAAIHNVPKPARPVAVASRRGVRSRGI